ncbi:DUF397 domain-containing protein [Streptosporangium sp. NPDC001559]|uniref:DUF397 domain-containing protein n=1 Tax=Streptosporangium sp. NPDC001559 TaxID=3366187 RepID=UPI0036E21D78
MPDLTPAPAWRKSSLGNGGNGCVEVATNLPGLIAVRDSKNPSGPALACPREPCSTGRLSGAHCPPLQDVGKLSLAVVSDLSNIQQN